MSYTIERLNDPAAYLVTLHEGFDPATEMRSYYTELIAQLDQETEPIDTIVDILAVSFGLNELFSATRQLQGMDINPTAHPMSDTFILVSNNNLMKLSVDGFRKFGIVNKVHIVKSVNEALSIAAAR